MVFKELQQQVVLIVGGAQGIGAAVRETFLKEGAVVVDADRQYPGEFTQALDGAYETQVDVADEASVKALVETLTKQALIPDIFVDVAGISTMDFLVDSQTSDFDQVQAVNTRGVYLLCKHVVKEMQRGGKGGRVILVASQAGKNGYRGMSAYVASKHAVLGLTKTLAIEVAADGILVNAVCPGIIETPMKWRERREGGQLRGMTAEEVAAEDRSQVPLGRTGEPADVANVVLFLASPLASYLTGQGINVTGGMTMN